MSERGYSIGDLLTLTQEFCDYKNENRRRNRPNIKGEDFYTGEVFQITREFDEDEVVITYLGSPSFNTLCPKKFIAAMMNNAKPNETEAHKRESKRSEIAFQLAIRRGEQAAMFVMLANWILGNDNLTVEEIKARVKVNLDKVMGVK